MSKSSFCSLAIAVMATVFGLGLNAAVPTDPTKALVAERSTSTTVVPGVWNYNFWECKAYAEKNGLPMIAVWSNGDQCPHCEEFEWAALAAPFEAWRKTSGVVLSFNYYGDAIAPINGTVHDWCWGENKSLGYYPFVRFYWVKNGTTIVDEVHTGDEVDSAAGFSLGDQEDPDYGTYNVDSRAMTNFIGKIFKAYKPVTTTPYNGGYFVTADTTLSHLEADISSTTNVPVYLWRKTSGASTNYLVCSFPGKSATTQTVYWASSATSVVTNVKIPSGLSLSKGTKATLALLKANKSSLNSSRRIWLVNKPAVSQENPLWIGERTASTLQAGEWTMDLDVATNRTAQQTGAAYTLAVVGGELWCPDCAGARTNLLNTAEFKAWATNNNVALVVVDVPHDDATSPTFMTRDIYTGPKTSGRGASGTAYLTRKMISDAAALKVFNRNHELCFNTWNPPSDNRRRLWLPTFVLLRKDGTVMGKCYGDERESNQDFPLNTNLARFNEMLTLASDPTESANMDAATTKLALGLPETGSNSLQAADLVDVWKLTNLVVGAKLTVTASGATSAIVSNVIIQIAGGKTNTLAAVAGNLTGGVAASCVMPATGDCYAIISGSAAVDKSAFALYKTASSIRDYSLATTYSLIPHQAAGVETVAAGDSRALPVASNTLYRVSVTAGDFVVSPTNAFELVEPGVYRALITGDASFTFSDAGDFVYQVWQPGWISFTKSAFSVSEGAGKAAINVGRHGGSSGSVTGLVSYVGGTAATNGTEARLSWPADVQVVWEDGKYAATNITFDVIGDTFFTGDQTAEFALTLVGGGATLGASSNLVVTITDDDTAAVGKLQFGSATPSYVRNWTVYANEGSDVQFTVKRTGGNDTDVSATVSATAGTLSTNAFDWVNHGSELAQTFTLTLPAYDAATSLITLQLTPSNTTAVTGCDKVYVQVVAADAPEFTATTLSCPCVQYVAMSNSIGLVGLTGGTVALNKIGGSTPSGLTVKYDAARAALVVEGTASASGNYTSVWQPVETRSGTAVPGIPVTVKIAVTKNTVLAKATTYFTGFATDTSSGTAATNRMTGAIALTVNRTGANTLTYRNFAGTFYLKSTQWDSMDASGVLSATCVSGKYHATISIDGDGNVTGKIFDAYFGHNADIECAVKDWSSSKPATAYKGYYTIDLNPEAIYNGDPDAVCLGHGYIGISMNATRANSGTYTIFGRLPDGTAFSGSSVLLPGASADVGILPIYIHTSVDTLTGILTVKKNGSTLYKTNPRIIFDATPFFWKHISTADSKATYQLRFAAYGGYYDASQNLIECCSNAYQTTSMFLTIDIDGLADSATHGGVSNVPSGVGVIVTGTTIKLDPDTIDSEIQGGNITFGFSRSSGVYWGTFPVEFNDGTTVTATFKGILLPGWGDDCGCKPVSEVARPFGIGACWYSDTGWVSGKRVSVKHGTKTDIAP